MEGKSTYAYENQSCSNKAVMSSAKNEFSGKSFHSSSEANVSHINAFNDRPYSGISSNSVNECIDLGNYPNQAHFACHMSNSINSSFDPQTSSQSQYSQVCQEIFVKTEKQQTAFNKTTSLQGDYSSKSDFPTQNFGYHHLSNNSKSPIISNEARESPSENSRVSEISRSCSVSNLSLEVHKNYDSPQTDPRYSPLSYQQNRYQPYACPSQTALQATNFSFFSHQNHHEAHNSQTNLHNNFDYNQQGQW